MRDLRITLLLSVFLLFLACAAGTESETEEQSSIETETEQQDSPPDLNGPKVKISTEFGDIIVVLYNDTPIHRDNFLKLIKEGFYEDLLFHRVMRDFMIQGGDPDSKGAPEGQRLGGGGPGYTIEAEIKPHHFHKKGALAAARKPDSINPEKRSSGSQFYIVEGIPFDQSRLDMVEIQKSAKMSSGTFSFTPEAREAYTSIGGYAYLDGDYTVFGEVIEGLDIVDSIAAVAVDRNSRPLVDRKMNLSILEE
jgi:peptidyl-prolyl cis-trans isomerase B (cyclophilin B)